MNYKLLNKNYEKELENKTIKEYILSNRNIDNPSAYLSLTKDNVHHYSLLENIDKAKNLLLETIKNKGKIGIIVDSDSDGYISASILYQYLSRNYDQSKLSYFIHTKKQHGIGDL
jgi:single-stranded-DNA-specific exonuclease